MKLKVKTKICLCVAGALLILILGIGIGSVFIPPQDILSVLGHKLFGMPLPDGFEEIQVGMVWSLRLPRVLIAFLVGAALAVCGSVMQSVLKNPLASSYGLGVSSGAGLGAVLLMISGVSGGILGIFLLPVVGLLFGLGTVVLAVWLASRIDKRLENNTIILTGMVFSLFINAILSTLAATAPQFSQRILLWQLGSFSMKDWAYVGVLLVLTVICVLFFMRYSRELDILTFGEEQAGALGINTKRTKWLLIGGSAVLTGAAVSFVGIIGFVDLIAPHVVRRYFGSSHKLVVPLSALFGGCFMVVADLLSRTLASPSEIPVGSITALVGAPFFVYIYIRNRKKR